MSDSNKEVLSSIFSNLKLLLDEIEHTKNFRELMRINCHLENKVQTTNFTLKISISSIKDEDLNKLTHMMNICKNNLSTSHSRFLDNDELNYNEIKNIAILELKNIYNLAYDLGIHL